MSITKVLKSGYKVVTSTNRGAFGEKRLTQTLTKVYAPNGKQVLVRILSLFISFLICHRLCKHFTIRRIDLPPTVLCQQHLLSSVIAIIDQLLLVGDCIMRNIARHTKKQQRKCPCDNHNFSIFLLGLAFCPLILRHLQIDYLPYCLPFLPVLPQKEEVPPIQGRHPDLPP